MQLTPGGTQATVWLEEVVIADHFLQVMFPNKVQISAQEMLVDRVLTSRQSDYSMVF